MVAKAISSRFIIAGMKKLLIFIVLLVAFLAVFVLLQKPAENESLESVAHVPSPQLFDVADRSNMVMIAAVGLGKTERRKVVSGRLYRNFVQLLKTNGEMDDAKTFTADCKVGARLEFYRDTILLGEFRMTNLVGRDGAPGVWRPLQSTGDRFVPTDENSGFWKRRRMAKIYKFLRDNGVHFNHCDETASESVERETAGLENSGNENFSAGNFNSGNGRILTMPKLGAARKARRNEERSAANDSVTFAAAEGAALPQDVVSESQNVLNLLDEMVLPADTAVGEPLPELFKNWNRGTVEFFDSTGRNVLKTVRLDEDQVSALGKLVKNTDVETYGMSNRMFVVQHVKITLFKDSLPEMELWEVAKGNYSNLLKCPLRNGTCIVDGFWRAAEPDKIRNFFESLQ